ncbi:hypothetical protein mru_2056 [Methanobrevibacter ruminantium M1]|uniref:Uncharacterized protein n=1 Tax=Methanobrevibacter ruminantium (strain ATCC 35063 / DSM 1093 / JCM 13430 / OCM 146 / M1) TaxID=634498 RepID=D3E0T2_METRM|nr:hypothetical protein [Methanobrevibacter ruminantium]ADC47906.1 hypothetical protein mru_2056 [Methanobrevibacter ruminantium M1]
MEIIELIAIIILVAAIVFLIYYYFQTVNGGSFDIDDLKDHLTISKREAATATVNLDDDEAEEKVSVGKKIKYTFKDIDKSYSNTTDAFSKRLDAFLDERSEELIENWSLVTTDDLESLEKRCVTACDSIDDLEKRFSEYSNVTNEKLEDLDKRIKALEEDSELLEEDAETIEKEADE